MRASRADAATYFLDELAIAQCPKAAAAEARVKMIASRARMPTSYRCYHGLSRH